MADDSRSLGKWLQDARVAKRLTLTELAPRLRMDPAQLGDIENERSSPSEKVLKEILAALGLDFEEGLARSGRISDSAREYLSRRPSAVILINRMAARDLPDERVRALIHQVEAAG